MHKESHLPEIDRIEGPQSGQASVLLLLMLSTFLIGLMAFAVDLTGLWFHRQAAQSAADAACMAGASDMLALQAGVTLPNSAFNPPTNGDCSTNSAASVCQYAKFNGFDGAGLKNSDGANAVTYTFPQSAPGVSFTMGNNPFLQVSITQNVKTYFAGMLQGKSYQPVSASSTCAVAYVNEAPPVVVLNPTISGAFYYSGGGQLNIVGGPSRGLQVNSSSPTGILWAASALIDMSKGGPNLTGSDVAVFGGPATGPTNGSSNGYNGGTTGHWSGHDLPIADPFGAVGPPSSVKSLVPQNSVNGQWVAYTQDGCPDHSGSHYPTSQACLEFSPGYYPNGLNLDNVMNYYSTAIFLPGIYYLNGPLVIAGSATMRMATPSNGSRLDGVMFYFYSGSLNISGCSGCSNSGVDNVSSTALTCDGTAPNSALNMPSTLYGNVLWGQCTKHGTYWDSGNDTTDFQGNPGSRGMLIYQDHNNTTSPQFTGSGALTFSGSLYLHSNSYKTILSLSGGTSSGTFVLGNIVADQISLTGSGKINLALNPAKTVELAKAALIQ